MAKYKVTVKDTAKKDYRRLPHEKLRRAILDKITGLDEVSKPVGCKKVRGAAGVAEDGAEIYRLRQGDYRVIYDINEEAKSVRVLRILRRKDAYRGRIT